MTKNKKTFSHHFEQWYEIYRKPRIREVSQQSYEVAIKHVQQDPIGDMEFKKIKRKDMQMFFNRFGKTRRITTVLDFKGFLSGCFSDAVHDGIIKVNPVARIEVTSVEDNWSVQEIKEKREEKKWLETEEYKKLKMAVISLLGVALQKNEFEKIELKKHGEKEPLYVFQARTFPTQMVIMAIYVALKSGARFSEIMGLTENDYCIENKILNIEKSWDYKFTKTFAPTKTNASIRKIMMDDEFTKVWIAYLNWLDTYDIPINQGAVFVRKQRQVYNSVYNDILEAILETLDIERLSFHKLRHSHASLLVDAGISLQVVAKRLGHTDTNMVQSTYAHLLEKTEEKENIRILKLI